MIKFLIVRYGIMQIERANMLKSKILNIVYGVLFGLLSYVIIMVMTVVFQQNDLSIWLSNFSFFFAFIYGIISICVFKSTIPERIIRFVTKPIAFILFFHIFFTPRNKILDYMGIILSDNPSEGLAMLFFNLSLVIGSVTGLISMGIITAVKKSAR